MSTIARVRVVVDIPLAQPWDDAISMKDIRRRAIEDAEIALKQGLVLNGTSVGNGTKNAATVVSHEVTAIIVKDEATR